MTQNVGENIHFEGDEDWELRGDIDRSKFFYGWFENMAGKLLEGGCGIGNYAVAFGRLGFDVYGVEYDTKRVELAKKNLAKYGVKGEIIQGDIRNMPYRDGFFDVVFSHGVVEHVPDTMNALKELNRVLKKGGYAMLSVPNKITSFTISKLVQKLIGKLIGRELWKCGYEKSFTKREFKSLLNKAGFEVLDERVSENKPGKRFPIVGRTLRTLDKPLIPLGYGGHFLMFLCRKR